MRKAIIALASATALFALGCGGGTSNSFNQPSPPGGTPPSSGPNTVPMISSLSPSCAPRGEQSLNPFENGQLLVNGQNFVANSIVRWNGDNRPTTFVSSSQLTAQISTSDIDTAGTATVTVFNPAPGGGSSNSSNFTITAGGVSPQETP